MTLSFGINGLSIYWKDIPEESAFAIRDAIFKEVLKHTWNGTKLSLATTSEKALECQRSETGIGSQPEPHQVPRGESSGEFPNQKKGTPTVPKT